MKTIAEIKIELKARGIKGYSGKNKAQLLAMLENSNQTPAKDTSSIDKPLSNMIHNVIKEINIEKQKPPTDDILEAIKSLGEFAWKRTGPGAEEAETYEHDVDNNETILTFKNINKNWEGYWNDQKPIIGKTINYNGYNKGRVKIDRNGSLYVYIDKLLKPDDADVWFEKTFGMTLMNRPNEATIKQLVVLKRKPTP